MLPALMRKSASFTRQLIEDPKKLGNKLTWIFKEHFRDYGARKALLLSLIHSAPRYVYLFSERKQLPTPAMRIAKTTSVTDDINLVLDKSTTKLPQHDEATIIVRGPSFDRTRINSMKGPLYLVNWFGPKLERDDVVYATGDQKIADGYRQSGLFPIYYSQLIFPRSGDIDSEKRFLLSSVEELFRMPDAGNIYTLWLRKGNTPSPPLGSALCVILPLLKLCKKVNIYGWDHYLPEKIENDYWKILGLLDSFCESRIPADIVESGIFNWVYASRITQMPNVTIEGKLSELVALPEFKKVVSKLEKVIYK